MLSVNGIPNPTGGKTNHQWERGRAKGEMEKETERDGGRKGDPQKDVHTKQQSILGHVEQGK